MTGRLDGAYAVITAGTAGIGAAIAERFITEGAEVLVTGSTPERADAAATRLGPHAEVLVADGADPADTTLADHLRSVRRPVDVLVVNAGRSLTARPIVETTPEQFDFVSDLSFRGAFVTLQQVVPRMADGGRIVLISSIAGHNGGPGQAVYNATKAAVRSLARTATAELRHRGIRANVVSPGPIDTDGFTAFIGGSEELRERIMQQIPVGRIGDPHDVAAAVLFLASDESRFIAGAELVVDGGMSQI